MSWILSVCLGILFHTSLVGIIIDRPVVNIYLAPEEGTEVDSQAIYGSAVEILEQADSWSKIQMGDGVEGWLLSSQLAENASYEKGENLRPIKSLFAHVYRVKDTTPYPPLLTLPYGSRIKLDSLVDTGERWVSVELASREKAWVQRGDIDFSPRKKSLEEVLSFSKKFLGLPYTWGGVSSYGFDCSGFVQMLFRETGILLPRNSRDQAESDLLISVEEEDLQPGDLLFFGQAKISHVGIYLGGGEFIHSTVAEDPMVMVSSLKNEKYHLLAAKRLRG